MNYLNYEILKTRNDAQLRGWIIWPITIDARITDFALTVVEIHFDGVHG